MVAVMRVRSTWTGFAGAPGYTNVYFWTTDPLTAAATQAGVDMRKFWADVQPYLPNTVTINVDPVVPVADDVDGKVFQELQMSSTPAAVVGLVSQAYSGPSGGVVRWNTGQYLNGHKILGRTYLVPLGGGTTSTAGQVSSSTISGVQTAINAFLASTSTPVVYGRPREAKAATKIDGSDAVQQRDGHSAAITSGAMSTKVCVLTSRRD